MRSRAITNNLIRRIEYVSVDKNYHRIYGKAITSGLIKRRDVAPSSVGEYSDGSIALYYPKIFPELRTKTTMSYDSMIAIRINSDFDEMWYKWYEKGNTTNITLTDIVVATGRFSNNPDKVTLYTTKSKGGFAIFSGGFADYEAVTYENGILINETLYRE